MLPYRGWDARLLTALSDLVWSGRRTALHSAGVRAGRSSAHALTGRIVELVRHVVLVVLYRADRAIVLYDRDRQEVTAARSWLSSRLAAPWFERDGSAASFV